MAKRIFAKKSRWEPKLFVIMGIITGMFALVLGGPMLLSRGQSMLGGSPGSVPKDAQQTLDSAHALLAQEAMDEAERVLQPLLRGNNPEITPQAIMLQADINHYRGDMDAALHLLTEASERFKGSRKFPHIAERKARQLEEMKQTDEARAIYESLRDNAPSEMRAMGYLGLGRLAERADELIEARDLYRRAVEDAPWGSPGWEEAVDLMGRLNVELIFSTKETPESRYYIVESGDTLINIGMKLNTTQGLLTRANNIEDASRLRPGQRLKHTPKDFFIIIERSTCWLYLFDSRGLFKRYHVGLGKPGHETALGRYTIGNKQVDPVWFKPGSEPIPAGDPENELGTRWMPMVPAEEGLPHDLGIHGTVAPDTIGTHASRGCARMHNHDVEELYDLVVRATPVEVVETIHDHHDDIEPSASEYTEVAATS